MSRGQPQGHQGMYSIYRNVKKYTRYLSCLIFLRRGAITQVFNELRHHRGNPPCLEPIYSYFYSIYVDLERARFPPSMWSISNINDFELPKTNNVIEGWHRVFKDTFKNAVYGFVNLVSQLKGEEEAIRQKGERLVSGENLVRNQRYINIENNKIEFINRNGG